MRGSARHVWMKYAVAGAIAALLLGGGYLWLNQRSPANRLGEACGGMLPVKDMLTLTGTTASGFGGADLELESWHFNISDDVNEPDGLAARCRANGVEVAIETATGNHTPYGTYTFQQRDDVIPVPLGSGWSGFLVAERDDEIGASVLLDCANWSRRQGSGILVTTSNEVADSGDASARAGLARLATRTAARAARHTGCDAQPGNRVDRVDREDTTAPKPADRAAGTCQSVQSRDEVRETAARTSPVERCVLVGGLVLRAAYGPFARGDDDPYGGFGSPSGENPTAAWGSARCKGSFNAGLYWAAPADDDPSSARTPLTATGRADLATFAGRSADRHGCSEPTLPEAPRK